MTQHLETLIAEFRTLSDEQQDAIAEIIADDLADLRLLEQRREDLEQFQPRRGMIEEAEQIRQQM